MDPTELRSSNTILVLNNSSLLLAQNALVIGKIDQAKRALAAFSCNPCSERKLLCDNVRPACGWCTIYGIQCAWKLPPAVRSSYSEGGDRKTAFPKLEAAQYRKVHGIPSNRVPSSPGQMVKDFNTAMTFINILPTPASELPISRPESYEIAMDAKPGPPVLPERQEYLNIALADSPPDADPIVYPGASARVHWPSPTPEAFGNKGKDGHNANLSAHGGWRGSLEARSTGRTSQLLVPSSSQIDLAPAPWSYEDVSMRRPFQIVERLPCHTSEDSPGDWFEEMMYRPSTEGNDMDMDYARL
ncbi:hypothetical protein CC1G_14695 [Coprinopsis cinerea okayama7|uniref:Zn(2)-C6 fungal-type domain-containing protein n=1 Tax=Coprinopsis cinerea (strain Okayama-7 / 130 / ATCC MYA-4618 / FGSC 9003) TaxID=240176 RepID=D6RMK9_COPC7|nr:hypothetical protein CC1G_14695 [Coprinopsis cinerea okayama7\|eukprot:XP_002911266.1 hypothetical protein CC1G_14695 [Coprinopsis cinerea okayama7\